MYTEASDMPWFGELAVWLNKPQGGTAKALMHTSCLALRHDDFLRFVQIMPEFRSCLTKKAKFWKGVTGQHSNDGHGVMQEAQLLQVRPPRACVLACLRACSNASMRRPPTLIPPPPARARQTRTAASVALRSGGGLGASKLVGGAAGGKQKALARAATAERWEKLVLGIMLIGKKPRADPHTFVPSMSLRVDEYKFVKPPRMSNVDPAAPLVRMPAFEQQPSKAKWNSSPR